MQPSEKPKPQPQPQPALDELFALLGQTDQGNLEQLFDRMRPTRKGN